MIENEIFWEEALYFRFFFPQENIFILRKLLEKNFAQET